MDVKKKISHAQVENLVQACMLAVIWAMTPQDHGGNPWTKDFPLEAQKALISIFGKKDYEDWYSRMSYKVHKYHGEPI